MNEIDNIIDVYEKVKPLVEKMKAKYPEELNLEGLEPALINDIAEIVLEMLENREKEIVKLIKEKGLHLGYANDIIDLITKK